MSENVKINKGIDIKLKGEAEKVYANPQLPETFAVKPPDFHGLTPKLVAKAGDEVKAGDVVFYDKYNEKVKFTAPVSGEIVEVKRGKKRRILEVKILADKEIRYKEFKTADLGSMKREEVIEVLLESGLWPFVKQRPYDVIANPEDKPKAIFISAFDSNPLAADNDFILHGQEKDFQTGLDAVAKLTEGKVHLTVNGKLPPSKVFTNAKGVQLNKISGPHPAGNVGVQIHHIDPINQGEVVWTLKPQDILTIGKFFKNGKYDASRIVALTGSEVEKPKYYRSMVGASIQSILNDNKINEGDVRYILGNPLTGARTTKDGFVGFYDNQITVLPEGNEPEFMGWLTPGLDKFSVSRTFLSWLMPGKKYKLDTAYHGEERAYVMTGQYEKVFPFDIYPVQLVKAIMVGDIELMEKLGVYEIAPEDFSLCEFVCTSKMEVQTIVRDGLDMVKKECG